MTETGYSVKLNAFNTSDYTVIFSLQLNDTFLIIEYVNNNQNILLRIQHLT